MGSPAPVALGKKKRRRRERERVPEEVCGKCGQEHPGCHGHARIYDSEDLQTRKVIGIRPCKKRPMHGQSVCDVHGGRGRNREAAARQWAIDRAQERIEKQMTTQLEQKVKTLGLPVTTTPQQALLDELYRTAGTVAWLEAELSKLKPEELTWGRTSEERRTGVGEMETQVDLTVTVRQARPVAMYEMYTRERAHLVHVAKVAIQCGIAERQVKLAEEQGRAIADALRAVFEDPSLELTVAQLTVARGVAAKVLRSISIGGRLGGSRPVPQLEILNGHNEE